MNAERISENPLNSRNVCISPELYLSLCFPLYISIGVSFSLFLYICLSICLSLYQSLFLSFSVFLSLSSVLIFCSPLIFLRVCVCVCVCGAAVIIKYTSSFTDSLRRGRNSPLPPEVQNKAGREKKVRKRMRKKEREKERCSHTHTRTHTHTHIHTYTHAHDREKERKRKNRKATRVDPNEKINKISKHKSNIPTHPLHPNLPVLLSRLGSYWSLLRSSFNWNRNSLIVWIKSADKLKLD